MRSFPVRLLCVLTIPLVVSLPLLIPRSSEEKKVVPLVTKSVPLVSNQQQDTSGHSSESDLVEMFRVYIDYYAARVLIINDATDGQLLPMLKEVLEDPGQSVSLGPMRIPAWSGLDRLMKTFPKKPVDAVEEHDRWLDIYFAAAIIQAESPMEGDINILYLANKYHLPPFDQVILAQQE